jgi:hypothetical protein
MKRRQREASRLLIASVDDSQIALGQRPGVDPIGGDGTTRLAWSRPTSTFWSGRRRELPSAKPRLAIVYFDFTARTSNDVFPVALKPCPSTWWTTAEEDRAGLHNGPDAHQSCVYRHTRYRVTPPDRQPDQGHAEVHGGMLPQESQRVLAHLAVAAVRIQRELMEKHRAQTLRAVPITA